MQTRLPWIIGLITLVSLLFGAAPASAYYPPCQDVTTPIRLSSGQVAFSVKNQATGQDVPGTWNLPAQDPENWTVDQLSKNQGIVSGRGIDRNGLNPTYYIFCATYDPVRGWQIWQRQGEGPYPVRIVYNLDGVVLVEVSCFPADNEMKYEAVTYDPGSGQWFVSNWRFAEYTNTDRQSYSGSGVVAIHDNLDGDYQNGGKLRYQVYDPTRGRWVGGGDGYTSDTITDVNLFFGAVRYKLNGDPKIKGYSVANGAWQDGYGDTCAAFVAQPTSGAPPLTVWVTDMSLGGPSAFSYDWGDGTAASSDRSALHIYTGLGQYTLSHTVTRDANYPPATDTRTVVIKTDLDPPTGGSIRINNGAQYTKSSTVTLTLAATDNSGSVEYRLANDGQSYPSTWSAFNPVTPFINGWLLLLGQGERKVKVEYRDQAGHTLECSDSIIVDFDKPVLGQFPVKINGGAAFTANHSVNLTFQVTDPNGSGVKQWSYWGTFTSPPPMPPVTGWSTWYDLIDPANTVYTLPGFDGSKTVKVKFRDAAGNESDAATSDPITLDTTPPTGCGLTVNDGDPVTTSRTVRIDLSVNEANLDKVQVTENDFATPPTVYNSVVGTNNFTLYGPDGPRTLKARYIDKAGHTADSPGVAITLNTTAIARAPVTLSPYCFFGQNAAGQSFEVWNSGGGTLNYSITKTADWLTVTPANGSSGSGVHNPHQVSYNTAGLAAGTHQATITINADGTDNSPQTIAVTLTVAAPHTITATAGPNGTITPSGAVPVNHGDSQSFTISPNTNSRILGVVVDGVDVGPVSSYTFNNVTTDHTITASFASNTVAILTDKDLIKVFPGQTAPLQVKLSDVPSAGVTVTVAWLSGSQALYIKGEPTLTFTPSDWDTYQTVQIAATPATNDLNARAEFQLSAPKLTEKKVTAVKGRPGGIAAGHHHSLARQTNGALWGWGGNNLGQLGLGHHTSPITTPTRTAGGTTTWKAEACGEDYTLAIRADGSLWAWGLNNVFQLGLGDTTNRNNPTRVGTATDWVAVAGGFSHSLFLKADGSLWACGNNPAGQLGLGDSIQRNNPTRVGTGTDWVAVAAGFNFSLFLKTDGSLWACGHNNYGQLGLNDTTTRLTPTRVGTGADWLAVAAGTDHSLFLKTDGSLWACGRNNWGKLGLGDTTNRNIPTRVGTDADWLAVAGGFIHSLFLKTDGSLWACGHNGNGALGLPDNNDRIVPTRVGTGTDWLAVAAGSYHSLGLKRDSLWAWGDNNYGELGVGDLTSRSSPVQVPWIHQPADTRFNFPLLLLLND